MTAKHYQPVTCNPAPSTVTNYNWSVGGCKSSVDGFKSYEISACKSWYVYKSKPKWFGEYPGDRYIGKRRWISSHADGKQAKYVCQRGDLDRLKIESASEKESDKIAHDLLLARGYLAAYDSGWMRREHSWYIPNKYPQSIRCAACGMTAAEHHRKRNTLYMDLKWPKDYWQNGSRMDDWAAFITARESVTCRCAYTPDQDRIAHHIRTGDGLRYD